MLVTAESFYRDVFSLPGAEPRGCILAFEKTHRQHEAAFGMPPLCTGEVKGPEAFAYVNRGRWVVDCPFGCGRSQAASETDRFFYCCGHESCFNRDVQHRAVPVVWPSPVDQETIERLLLHRPIENQNWLVGEPIEVLVAENTAYGLPGA